MKNPQKSPAGIVILAIVLLLVRQALVPARPAMAAPPQQWGGSACSRQCDLSANGMFCTRSLYWAPIDPNRAQYNQDCGVVVIPPPSAPPPAPAYQAPAQQPAPAPQGDCPSPCYRDWFGQCWFMDQHSAGLCPYGGNSTRAKPATPYQAPAPQPAPAYQAPAYQAPLITWPTITTREPPWWCFPATVAAEVACGVAGGVVANFPGAGVGMAVCGGSMLQYCVQFRIQ